MRKLQPFLGMLAPLLIAIILFLLFDKFSVADKPPVIQAQPVALCQCGAGCKCGVNCRCSHSARRCGGVCEAWMVQERDRMDRALEDGTMKVAAQNACGDPDCNCGCQQDGVCTCAFPGEGAKK